MNLIWGAPQWQTPSIVMIALAVVVLLWAYTTSPLRTGWRWLAAGLKTVAFLALAFCLLEPLVRSERPRPGANLFVLLSDASRSMDVRDANGGATRGSKLQDALRQPAWQARLAEVFDVRNYEFDETLRNVGSFADLKFEGQGSRLSAALQTLKQRHRDRPVAGVLLFTDGNATDVADEGFADLEWLDGLPPIYPILVGNQRPPRDARIGGVGVTQTLFETTPVTVRAEAAADGMNGRTLLAELLDQEGDILQTKDMGKVVPERRLTADFLVKPDRTGALFYQVRVRDKASPRTFEEGARSDEATLDNNRRWVVAQRGKGPYRVLYVGGRPNWEFKFLRRALQADEEVELIGLLRIAKREAKFDFRGRQGERANSVFRGFDPDEEAAEQYDQPVLLRMGKLDEGELSDGFPKSPADLFRYDAIILDDLEADFFTADQLNLMHRFVSVRGGGLLMLGGQESFVEGGYRNTRLDELLPVYLDPPAEPPKQGFHRWGLTREGALQPWARTRATQDGELERLAMMPEFHVLNRVNLIKPGATVLAEAADPYGASHPALVTQRFGEGRTGAMLIGDFWRWSMRAPDEHLDEAQQAWRQTVRWLVSDVPRRMDVGVQRVDNNTMEINVKARDEEFQPLENARITLEVTRPGGETFAVAAMSSPDLAGQYVARYSNSDTGPYLVKATAIAPDGQVVGEGEAGWVADPEELELRTLTPNKALLEEVARRTGGQIAALDGLERLVSDLPRRKTPVSEPWVYPLWHQWYIFALAAVCLVGEWTVRRWCGLP